MTFIIVIVVSTEGLEIEALSCHKLLRVPSISSSNSSKVLPKLQLIILLGALPHCSMIKSNVYNNRIWPNSSHMYYVGLVFTHLIRRIFLN